MRTRGVLLRGLAVTTCVALLMLSACSWTGSEEAEKPRPLKIPIIEGMTYYVGGPVVANDSFGRTRFRSFAGEVEIPPSRGMVIGHKDLGNKAYEYRVWINGDPLSLQRGTVDDEGFLLNDYQEGFAKGKLVGRLYFTYDDEKEKLSTKVEHVDPETGELIKTEYKERDYVIGGDDWEEDEDDEDDGELIWEGNIE